MDDIGLATLFREMQRDCEVAEHARTTAHSRFAEAAPSGLEGCAHHLVRMFNVIEQLALRVARTFENHIDDERGWHAELIRRVTLEIPGVRPRLFPQELLQPLRELRAFRHVINHAYDLTLDAEKLRLLLRYADTVGGELPSCARRFVDGTATMHGLRSPVASPEG